MDTELAYRLIFLRHGQTDWNVEERLQGQRDIPLNGIGRDQAASAGRSCKPWLESDLNFLCSPLQRTRETMTIARQAMGLQPSPFATDDRLKEISFGDWEGMTWGEIEKADPARANARDADKWGYAPPGGESYVMLAERIKPVLAELSADTLIVSHGGVARALMALIGGVSPKRAPLLNVYQGRPLVFEGGRCKWYS
ncbi:MAG: phosphoglycerate mutase family protein [Hyphomicrobiales bacterium]|nr:phosphoglycerate mutase family protein [Hyphomicrobiales bacterium]MDE2114022.1 histidine phosphatase family protein [Hyphomicrobiales bacterium]